MLLLTLCFLKKLCEGRKCTCSMRWLEGIRCFPLPISGHMPVCVTLRLNKSPTGVVLKAGFVFMANRNMIPGGIYDVRRCGIKIS